MALVRTTLSGGVSATDLEILLASLTGLSVNSTLKIDGEQMRVQALPSAATVPVKVLRGVNGTNVAAHPTGAGVVAGDPADFAGKPLALAGRVRDVVSYSASGALTLPTPGRDMVAILNGTTLRAMTLAVPTKENDGDILIVVGNGKAAHTVTISGGLGAAGAGYTVGTFDVGAQCSMEFIAANEVWVPLGSPMSGTLTAADVAVA